MPREHVVEPFVKDQPERGFHPHQQVLRRGAAELPVRQLAPAPRPVPVEARRRVARCDCGSRCVDRDKADARTWYDKAVEWMEKNQPKNDELRRFRAEAAKLLEPKEKK